MVDPGTFREVEMGAQRDWDVIVIGSGMGGLTAASLLAQLEGQRVLVLERHRQAGGFTQSFQRRGGFAWDVGVHAVGGMGEGTPTRRIMDRITGGAVDWSPLPDPHERYIYPDIEFEAPSGEAALRDALSAAFPKSHRAVNDYFRDVHTAAHWRQYALVADLTPSIFARPTAWLARRAAKVGGRTTGSWLDEHVDDPMLRAVLASQWGNYGLPPRLSAFAMHSMFVEHFMDGASYPVGGTGAIARAVESVVGGHGGEIRTGREVSEILLEGGRAVGVRARHHEGDLDEIEVHTAPVIVSDAGARTTFNRLIHSRDVEPLRQDLDSLWLGTSAVACYLGLDRDPRELGHRGENIWIYTGYEHDRVFSDADALFDGRPRAAYVTFPSARDPSAREHTAEIVTFARTGWFHRWSGSRWKDRPADYEAFKQRAGNGLIALVDRHLPGFASSVVFREVSTPLTIEHFTGHIGGTLYGLPGTPDRYRLDWLGPRTPVEGLFLTGSDAVSHGVMGAAMGGIACAACQRGGFGLFSVMRELTQALGARAA